MKFEILSDGEVTSEIHVDEDTLTGELPRFLKELQGYIGSRSLSLEQWLKFVAETQGNQSSLLKGNGIRITDPHQESRPVKNIKKSAE